MRNILASYSRASGQKVNFNKSSISFSDNVLADIASVEHVGGDMFVEVPKGEAIFMKWILLDWSDDQRVKILKNCYDALPESGKVIVERTIEELKALATKAGFTAVKLVCRAYCFWLVELYK
ncbi:hypothetical protein WN943_023400 [Citrus x changshan-huyou]